MIRMFRTLHLLFVLGLTAACVSLPERTHMQTIPDSVAVRTPAPGMALVYFVRTSKYGGAFPADLYDGEEYIGSIFFGEHIAYQANPGQHLFMVVGQTAEFMPSELIAGKTYYAKVGAHPASYRFLQITPTTRFHLSPQNGNLPQDEIQITIDSSRQVGIAEGGRKWAAENADTVRKMKAEYLPTWEQSGQRAKQTLNATSGR